MRSPLILLLISLLVVGCGQKEETPPVASAPTQTQAFQPIDNDYGNPNLKAGNPSKATQDAAKTDNYLILRPQYVLSYNRSRNIANWASWELNKLWMGKANRQSNFHPDATLPKGWYQVTAKDYDGSGFERGHLVNSQDRSRSAEDNSATFLMTNIVPQAPDNNQVAWEKLDAYSRDLANQGKELYIVAGGTGTGGEGKNGIANSLRNNVTVPSTMWKVILVLDDPTKGLAGVNANTRTIAVIMPNKQGRNHKWQDFCATVDDVQKLTGYNFFTNVAPDIRAKIDTKKGC